MATVVLDPGQGTAAGGIKELVFTRDIAVRVAAVLGRAGHKVELTRPDARARLGLGKDVFVTIDFNGFPDPSVQGTETMVHPGAGSRSWDLARRLQAAVQGTTGHRDRGVQPQALAVLARFVGTQTAAAQVEVSFLSDPNEVARLKTEDYRSEIAGAVARAILGYLQGAYPGFGDYGVIDL